MKTAERVRREPLLDGRACLLELGPPPGNILDTQLIADLEAGLEDLAGDPGLKAVLLAGAGEHFGFGASVPEHMPGEVEKMLPRFHQLLRRLDGLPLPPVLAVVRGRCLGGSLELALACDLMVVERSAQLASPEIVLGVFPPAACALLPLRLGAGSASRMVLTGASWSGEEALAAGLGDVPADPGGGLEAARGFVERELLPKSAAALRQARQAARAPLRRALEEVLPGLEQRYLQDLMQTEDAREGLEAFLQRRTPEWRDR